MNLSQIRRPKQARKNSKRKGRGNGSGLGGTSGRGSKGQKARSGGGPYLGFEGGQMPLTRRLPKRGFRRRKEEFQIVKLKSLSIYPRGCLVRPEELEDKGLIRSKQALVKILGEGEISHPLTIKAHAFSQSAKEKIKKAGGKAEFIREYVQ